MTARRLCPDLIFVPARFGVYKAVSQQIRDIFREYTELVEPLSLDEAFLDVTHERSATLVAREIKARIRRQTELTASAGVSVNKMLAKIASDYRKPDGLFTIAPSEVEAFVAALPVKRFFGIGAVTAERMHRMGIHTGADLRQWDEAALVQRFGKAGHAYYGYARGVDEREVEPHRVRKSVGAETTFAEDTDDRTRLSMELAAVREEVWNRIQRHEFRGKTVVLKLKYDDFRQITRSKTLFTAIDSDEALCRVSEELLAGVDFHGRKVRLIGLTVGNTPEACADCVQLRFDFGEGVTVSSVFGEVLSRELFSLYLSPYRTDYSGVLLLSLLLGLCPCEKGGERGRGDSSRRSGSVDRRLHEEPSSYWKGAATGCAGLYVSGTVRLYLPDEVEEWMLVQAAGGDRRDARRPFFPTSACVRPATPDRSGVASGCGRGVHAHRSSSGVNPESEPLPAGGRFCRRFFPFFGEMS